MSIRDVPSDDKCHALIDYVLIYTPLHDINLLLTFTQSVQLEGIIGTSEMLISANSKCRGYCHIFDKKWYILLFTFQLIFYDTLLIKNSEWWIMNYFIIQWIMDVLERSFINRKPNPPNRCKVINIYIIYIISVYL